ncbi:Dyp-type peroxidase family [Frankineae bacterium MT45]|nr:Dyp-type peroxidase family [Frankineae bacterium MT45]
MTYADGVLPDAVSRDPHSQAWLIFVDLAPDTDIKTWLRDVATPARDALVAGTVTDGDTEIDPDAVCTVGFGSTVFDKAGISAVRPSGLAAALPPNVPSAAHDLVFYVFTRADVLVASFLRTLAATDPAKIVGLLVERGYQRADKREIFGNRDGLRNGTPTSRPNIAFVPGYSDEPSWTHGGSYLAYLKVTQDVEAWQALSPEEQAAVIGRKADGTRADLPDGTPATEEGEFTQEAVPPATAHIRKAGPRGAENDPVQIFRRGVPFVEVTDNKVVEGLQFVSYQANIADFLTILGRWMNNANFPAAGTGIDALFQHGLATIAHGGLYFAVPHDPRFIGAGAFDDPNQGGHLRIVVQVTDASGAQDPAATLAGATFTITDPAGVSQTAVTTASGCVTVSMLPIDQPLTVSQTVAPAGASVAAPQTVTLNRCTQSTLTFIDARTASPGGYGT